MFFKRKSTPKRDASVNYGSDAIQHAPNDKRGTQMSRIPVIDTKTLEGAAKANVDRLAGMIGFVPSLLGAMANAPKALHGYRHLEDQLMEGSISGPIGELVALTIAEFNGCDYCLGAHTKIGDMMGVTAQQAEAARHGDADDAKSQAVLDITQAILRNRGRVTDYQLNEAVEAGVTHAEMVEIICHIGAHTISNYMSRLAQYEPDFPAVPASKNG